MIKDNLDYDKFTLIENDLLKSRLEALRAVLKHSAEKGRALEYEVTSLIRSFLPNEYGLATGFIAYRDNSGPKLSSQLDIIIYDALRGAPLVDVGTCAVLPIEFVYGYIEVKAILKSSSEHAAKYAENSIEKCIQKSKKLRSITTRHFYVPSPVSVTRTELKSIPDIAIRSYIFAFQAEDKVTKTPKLMA